MEIEFNRSLMPLLNLGLEKLHLEVPQYGREKLLAHIKLLQKWNKAYNLTALQEPRDLLVRHIFDSLAIAPYVKGPNILDVGTGAGFPGIPLAIVFPEYQVFLLDSNHKKTTFLTHVILSLGITNVKVLNLRVEDFHFNAGFDTIVTRATMSLNKILMQTKHLGKRQLLVMKGKIPEHEMAEISIKFSVVNLNVPGLDAARHLIIFDRYL